MLQFRQLSPWLTEAYNAKLRIRLEWLPAENASRVTVFVLKPNGFYRDKATMRVERPITIQEAVGLALTLVGDEVEAPL